MADGINTAVFLAANASYAHTNPAAWSLGNAARAAGWNWRIIETSAREPMQPLLLRLGADAPKILAASFFLFNREFLLAVLARFKRLHPDCLILGGGPEFLGDNRAGLEQYRFIDAVIRGEGEQALADFLPVWNRPACWHDIAGLCAMRLDEYIDNGLATRPNLEALPSVLPADLSDFKKPFLLLETARGCAAQCVFCTSGAGHPPTRRFTLAYARASLRRLAAIGLPEVRIADRTFNESSARCIQMLRMFRDEFSAMRFHLEIDPGRLTDEVMAEFAAARPGQLYLEVGVQTLKAKVFAQLGRCGRLADAAQRTRQLCAMRHLQVHTDLIAGLPGGTLADLLDDLQTLVAMRPAVIQLEILKLLPGTALAADPARYGITAAPAPPYETLATAGMPASDMETARQLSRLLDWFYNTPDLQTVTAAAGAGIKNFWLKLTECCCRHTCECDAPSLERRFKLMDDFLKTHAAHMPELIHRLHYARLRHSLTHGYGIDMQPWKSKLPANARLVEGNPDTAHAHAWLAQLDRPYFFIYGHGSRRAAAIYCCDA